MNAADVSAVLEANPLFDIAILQHGFARFMRDYLVVVEADWIGRAGRYEFRFTHCPEANVISAVSDNIWQASWQDAFIDYQRWIDEGEPEGYVWGVCWSNAYPGLELVANSELAAQWRKRLAHEMHEVTIETGQFRIQLIFHGIVVTKMSDEVAIMDKVSIPIRSF